MIALGDNTYFVLVVYDVVRNTEITIFGKVFAFTLQKFQALNRLTLAQRIELFFYNNSYTEVEQTNTDGLNSPEE